MHRAALGLLGLSMAACVYPATEPTGMELSWRFVEHNEADGEEAVRVRSCAGALTEQIAVEVHDQDAPTRHGIFRFDCAEGYQTQSALQTQASDAFIRLDPGLYSVTMHAVADATNAADDEPVQTREIEVEERIITIASWELRRAPVDWNLELRNAQACTQLTMALYYATPEADLAEYTPDDEQSLPLYRQALASDRGLMVDSTTIDCAAELDGPHGFEGLDRGEYLLEIVADTTTCALRLDLRSGAGAGSVIDLANLPCDG